MGGIGTIVPLTLMAKIAFWGHNDFNLWVITCVVNVPMLVVNLAAQPTKVTLPVMFSAWFIDLIVVLYCVFLALSGN